MRWWQVGALASVIVLYSLLLGLKERWLREAEVERDRLAAKLAEREDWPRQLRSSLDEIRDLRARVRELDGAPVRGPYPDGQSDERFDPWRPGTRQPSGFGIRGAGVWVVTCDEAHCSCAAGPLVPGLPSPPTAGEVPHP